MAQLKMTAPNVTYIVIPESGIALKNPLRPTSAEINAGVNITCAVVDGAEFNPTDSEVSASRSVCDVAPDELLTFDNFEGSMTLFFSDITVVTALYNTARALFKNGGYRFYLARRIGNGQSAVAASAEEWDIFLFESDLPRNIRSDEGDYQMEVPLLAQGEMRLDYALTA